MSRSGDALAIRSLLRLWRPAMLPKPAGGRLGPRVVASVFSLLVGGAAIVASAQVPDEPIRLDYRASVGCPDEAAFFARIRARTSSARIVGPGEPARIFSVELESGPPSWGSVTITDGGRAGTRRLDADSCDEAADGLALMVALALDPRASGTSAPIAAGADTGDALSPAEALDGALPRRADDAEATFMPPSVQPDAAPSTPPLPPPPSDTASPSSLDLSARHFVVGADVAIATAITPETLFAGTPFVGWRSSNTTTLAAAVRLAFLRAGTGVLAADSGSADFTWTVGRLDGCVTLSPTPRLWLSPCARLEGGILDVSGVGVPGSQTRHSPWIAAGPLARVEWRFWGPLSLDAALASSFHLTADRFYLLPNTTAYQVPPVGLTAEAGLGLSL